MRDPRRNPAWPPWVPPSPGIRAWETAQCYPATVCCEALPSLDFGQGTALAFQIVGSPWLDPEAVCAELAGEDLPGVRFFPHWYHPATPPGDPCPAVRLAVTDADRHQPVRTSEALLRAIQRVHGTEAVWSRPPAREDFFGQLYGTDVVRKALQAGASTSDICAGWRAEHAAFRTARSTSLLYPPAGEGTSA